MKSYTAEEVAEAICLAYDWHEREMHDYFYRTLNRAAKLGFKFVRDDE